MCDTSSHGSDHLWLIWKESIKNCRCYRADTAGGTDGRTDGQSDGQTDGRTDGVKPIYPPTTSLFGGINTLLNLSQVINFIIEVVVTDRFHCICFRCLCQSCNVTMYIFQSCHLCYVIYTCDWPFALCTTLAINAFNCNCHCHCHSLYPLMAGQHKVAYHNHISSNTYKIYIHNTTHLNTKRNGAHGEICI